MFDFISYRSQLTATRDREQVSLAKIRELEQALSVERARVQELKGKVDAKKRVKQQARSYLRPKGSR